MCGYDFAPEFVVAPQKDLPKAPGEEKQDILCAGLNRILKQLLIKFHGYDEMAGLQLTLRDESGRQSYSWGITKEIGKDVAEEILGKSLSMVLSKNPLSEGALATGMAYAGVNASFELGKNIADGEPIKAGSEAVANVIDAAQFGGRLSGATGAWVTKAIPGKALYSGGKIAIGASKAAYSVHLNNSEHKRMQAAAMGSISSMRGSESDINYVIREMKNNGCSLK